MRKFTTTQAASKLLVLITWVSCLAIAGPARGQTVKINFRLYTSGGTVPADGSSIIFNDTYSNFIDEKDAVKLSTPGVNLGILRNDTILVVEGRHTVTDKDTLTFVLWNLANIDYRLEMIPQNIHPNLTALLVDSAANTTEAIDLSSSLITKTFTVTNDPYSGGGGVVVRRFAILFAQIPPLPVTFLSIGANRRDNGIAVGWKVAEERGIANYEVQRSPDGRNFVTAGTVRATGSNAYNWTDLSLVSGNSFYRIKSISVDGQIKFSNIAKVFAGNTKPGISVMPNPVEGSVMNLQFINGVKGRFEVSLVNVAGQVVYKAYTEHAGGNSVSSLILPASVTRGAYQFIAVSPEKTVTKQKIFINSIK